MKFPLIFLTMRNHIYLIYQHFHLSQEYNLEGLLNPSFKTCHYSTDRFILLFSCYPKENINLLSVKFPSCTPTGETTPVFNTTKNTVIPNNNHHSNNSPTSSNTQTTFKPPVFSQMS